MSLLTTLSGNALADDDCGPETMPDPQQGCYVDRDGNRRHAYSEYKRRIDALDPDYLRAAGQQLIILGLGTLWYWADTQRNVADWDFPAWKQRFTLEAWTFDNNHFPINWLGHPGSGGAYYAFPRANDLSFPIAASYAFVTNFAWEFLIEFREKVSINDIPVTTGAGITIGEFGHKFWRYFAGLPKNASTAQLVASTTFGVPFWVHRAVDGKPQHVDGPYDELGFSSAIGHRVELGYQGQLHQWDDETRFTHGFFVGGRLSSIPGEGQPGSYSMFFHEADVSRLRLEAGIGERARELHLHTDLHLLGLYHQDIDRHSNGWATVLGLTMAYKYRFRDFEGYSDRLGILHIPGPGSDFHFRFGKARFNTFARVNGDFAGIHSSAFRQWEKQNVGADDKTKSILQKHGYYYALGVSTRFGAELVIPPFDLRAAAMVGAYDSQESLDRTQPEVTIDPDLDDRVLELDTSLGFTVPTTSFRASVGWSTTRRTSRIEDLTVETDLHTVTTSVGASM